MKVALDVSAVPTHIAGAGRYVVEIAKRLPHRGVSTTLVSRSSDGERWPLLAPGTTTSNIVPDSRIARLAYEALALGTSSPARAADVWHAPHYTMPHRGSTPSVVTIHDLTFFTNPEWHEASKVAFFKRAMKYSAQHAKVLISVSEFTARLIDEYLPGHAPVVVAPHGVDLERFSPDGSADTELLSGAGLNAERPYIFFLGTFEPRKGIDVLLEAFKEIATRQPEVELWLAGQSGWGISSIEESIAEHPAKERIRRLGFVDDRVLPSLLRNAACVVYPSRGEGFGLPVLEALACGASVVTSSDTVMAEVAGTAAWLTSVGDAAALAATIDTVVGLSASDREVQRLTARRQAETFTWDTSLDQHLRAYQLAAE